MPKKKQNTKKKVNQGLNKQTGNSSIASNYAASLVSPWTSSPFAKLPGSSKTTSVHRKGMFQMSVAPNTNSILIFVPNQIPSTQYITNFYTPTNIPQPLTGVQSAIYGVQPFAASSTYFNVTADIAKFRTVSAYVAFTNITAELSRSCMSYIRVVPLRISSSIAANNSGSVPLPIAAANVGTNITWPIDLASISNFTTNGATATSLDNSGVVIGRWYPTPDTMDTWSTEQSQIVGNNYSGSESVVINVIAMIFDNQSSNQQVLQFKYGTTYEICSTPTSLTGGSDISGRDGLGNGHSTLDYLAQTNSLAPLRVKSFPSDYPIQLDFPKKKK